MRVRTEYSFRHAAGKLPDVIKRLQTLGWGAAPIADRLGTYAFAQWAKLTAEADLRPIYGVELPVTSKLAQRNPDTDYWTFYAIKDIRALYKLIAQATANIDGLLLYAQAMQATGLVKIAGERAQLTSMRPDVPNLYMALSPATPKGLYNDAKAQGYKFIATSDNVYLTPDDREFYRCALGRVARMQSYPQHLLTDTEWTAAVAHLADAKTVSAALANRAQAMGQCKVSLPKATLLKPQRRLSLRTMCTAGAAAKGCDLNNPVYKARLGAELKLIKDKKFEDYFYIVAELVNWAKQHMVVGPARGSSCGSLVCYLLNITAIDPIKFGLLFERFIDITRQDLPDIDIDFEDGKRDMVFRHAEEVYGKDRIARLGTVSHYMARSALKAAAAVLRIPDFKINRVLDVMIERTSGDARANEALTDTFKATETGRDLRAEFPALEIAERMEGHASNAGQHAAGIVLTQEPIVNYVALDMRNKARMGIAMCDKRDVDTFGLLKIDALGLTQLGVFARTLELIGKPATSEYLENIPLNDQTAFDVLNKRHYAGVFQFNGIAVQSMAKAVHITQFNDLVAMTALGRPGPMGSGGAQHWSQRRAGKEPVTFVHPLVKPYLEDTLGVVTFQEQVMRLGRELGDLSWKDVAVIRKAMSKSMGQDFFDTFGNKWKVAVQRKGMPKDIADKFWMDLCSFGNWCVCGKTKLLNPHPNQTQPRIFTIKDLFESKGHTPFAQTRVWKTRPPSRRGRLHYWVNVKPKRQKLYCLQGKTLKPAPIVDVSYSGKQETWLVKVNTGESIRTTLKHRFLGVDGKYWQLGDLRVGDQVMMMGATALTERKARKGIGRGGQNWWPKFKAGDPLFKRQRVLLHKRYKRCQRCKRHPYEETHHINMDHKDHRLENLMPVCRKCHMLYHKEAGAQHWPHYKGKQPRVATIVSISKPRIEDTYDIAMPTPHNNFVAEGFIVHNSFNKSHAVAYAMVSYWCCWFKAHYPIEFAAATLDAESDPQLQIALLRELKEEGIDYVPVDADHSTAQWVPKGNNTLVGPLTAIKGIGPVTTKQIIASRATGKALSDGLQARLANAETAIGSLYPIRDAIAQIDLQERNVVSTPSLIKDVQCNGDDFQEVMIIGVLRKLAPKDLNEAVNVAKRLSNGWGGAYPDHEPHLACNIFIIDDTDQIFCQIGRKDYNRLALPMLERGGVGTAIYAIKGVCPSGFRMIRIKGLKYLGDFIGGTLKPPGSKSQKPKPPKGGDDENTGVVIPK